MFKQLSNILLRRQTAEASAPSLDGMLENTDKHIHNYDSKDLILPLPESKPRTPFDSGLPASEMTMANLSGRQRLRVIPRALPLFWNMTKAGRMYDGTKHADKKASAELISQIETMMKAAGAKDIAFIEVPRNAIFQGKGLPAKYAIVYTVEMDKEPIETSPSFESQLEVMSGYKNLSVIADKTARYLQRQGFAAYPGTALGGVTDYPHLAELAGLGAIGYHGLLISPGEGARLRIGTIYTNISNLPIKDPAENEHLWVRDFCDMCRKCVRKCPVDAIYETPEPRGDGGMQCIDHGTCRDYFARNYGCAVCLAVCPFSHSGYDKVQAKFKGNEDAPQFMIPVSSIEVV